MSHETLSDKFYGALNEQTHEMNSAQSTMVFVFESQKDTIASLTQKVEEMQKTLEWYADEKNYDVFEINTEEQGIIVMTEYWTNVTKDEGERARQALKGDTQ